MRLLSCSKSAMASGGTSGAVDCRSGIGGFVSGAGSAKRGGPLAQVVGRRRIDSVAHGCGRRRIPGHEQPKAGNTGLVGTRTRTAPTPNARRRAPFVGRSTELAWSAAVNHPIRDGGYRRRRPLWIRARRMPPPLMGRNDSVLSHTRPLTTGHRSKLVLFGRQFLLVGINHGLGQVGRQRLVVIELHGVQAAPWVIERRSVP